MPTPDLIRARHVGACVEHQRSLGRSVYSQLDRAGIPPECLENPAGVLPTSYFARFLSSACSASELSAFSYQAAPEGLAAYPELQRQIGASKNLIDLFAGFSVGASEVSGLRFRLGAWERKIWIYATSTSACLKDLGWSSYLVRPMIEIARAATGSTWWPETVRLPSAHTVQMESLDLPPAVNVELRSNRAAVEIPGHVLFQPIDRQRPPRPRYLPPGADDEDRELPAHLTGAVRLLLKTYMGKRPLPISELASLADCSVRSLQRELREAGCSFSSLLQDVRYLSSVPLLMHSSTSITELAYELGYSDPAHFSRAFQRVSGTSPSAFRRLNNAPA